MSEWRAEFWHSFANRQGSSVSRQQMRLRALGAFADAWTLLQLDCGFRRRVRDVIESRPAPILVMTAVLIAMALGTGGFREARVFSFHEGPSTLVLIAQPNPFMGGNSMIRSEEVEAWAQHSRAMTELGTWLVQNAGTTGRHERVLKADANAIDLFSEAEMKPRFNRIEPIGVNVPSFVGVVARLRESATLQTAEQELAQIAGLHKGWQSPSVIPLDTIRRAPLAPIGSLLLALAVLSALPLRRFSMRAWPWALAGIGLCFSTIAACWIELVARAPVTETAGFPGGWNWALYALPACAGAGATWWFRRDARRRCHTCYRVWKTPVSVGLPGRCLLDPSGLGYLCDDGHGAMLEAPALGAFEEGTLS